MVPSPTTRSDSKSTAKAQMMVPLSEDDHAGACRLSFNYVKNIDGGALEFQMLLDATQEKPAFWEDAKGMLKELGFQLKSGFGLEDDEVFLVGSFLAADIGICGTKKYRQEERFTHLSDVSRILEWMQVQVPNAGVCVS